MVRDPLAITRLTISATTGQNKRPVSGDVSFADGKDYSWSDHKGEGITFTGYRKRHDTWGRFGITSPRRAKKVQDYLDSDQCPPVTVFKVTM